MSGSNKDIYSQYIQYEINKRVGKKCQVSIKCAYQNGVKS